jgi:hypothetical protein
VIAHHFSGTSLAIELTIVVLLVAGAAWLWLRERRRRRGRALGDPRAAPMRDPEDTGGAQRGDTNPP